MASGKVKNDFLMVYENVTVPTKSVSANSYAEWTDIDISKSGYEPIAVVSVYPNRAGIALCGFSLNPDTGIAYLMVRNVTSSAVSVNSGWMRILYRKV